MRMLILICNISSETKPIEMLNKVDMKQSYLQLVCNAVTMATESSRPIRGQSQKLVSLRWGFGLKAELGAGLSGL